MNFRKIHKDFDQKKEIRKRAGVSRRQIQEYIRNKLNIFARI